MLDHPNLRPADEPISSVHPEDTSILKALSAARLAANRANARHSTGPSTPAGKLRSAANATLAQVIPLSKDERPVYEQFLADYAAAEHQLFQNGLVPTPNPEALTFVNSLASCKDPLATLSIYEQRLNRRLLQTLKELRSIQSDCRDRENRRP